MEQIVEIPNDVEVMVDDRKLVVKGPNGTIEKSFDDPRFNDIIKMESHGSKLIVKSDDEHRKIKSMIGTICAHTKNMVRGVQTGYRYTLKIVFTHFPMTITVEKNEVHIKNFLGEKGARIAKINGDAKVNVEKEIVVVTGNNREHVGQTAANIERACKLKGRDRRIFQDGVYISEKGNSELSV